MRSKIPSPVPTGDIYVVVADAGRARIFSAVAGNGKLEELVDLVNPQARLRPRATEADNLGTSMNSMGGTRHAVEPHQTPREHSAEMFAKRVARLIEKARTDARIGRLYLIAQPDFLGLLRKNLGKDSKRLVAGELAKAMSHESPADIRTALPAHL